MKDSQPQAIYLSDYKAPLFLIEKTDLIFSLTEEVTTVTSTLLMKKNPERLKEENILVLHGQDLVLQSIAVDGRELSEPEYSCDDETLTLTIPDKCIITCVTQIKPQENTSLEGLYKSSGMYCTQCEAEGFRKITYYLDRPDVMSEFTTKIIAKKSAYPILLSNGNLIHQGELDNGLHWAQWHDPFKKPAYLFALVAGDLSVIEDHFVTMSGRTITLRIFVAEKDLDKCDHAMESLKRAMKWDEKVYGREYDLDIFMIVAVDDFNMGAMENKGLNIFNTSCVLSKPETTTDTGFQRVEAVVAHEYFHNWSGNRVTCRDWFQLSLKEGFTVFRDEEFSADMGSRPVNRIANVSTLRTLQFAEDASPMAHPVQPPSYIEISNFYTLTIYEKGSEVVRMLHTLLGAETFREGSDLYFKRHDSEAVTINDFVNAMETVSNRDLSQFKYWYTQAGTPLLTISENYNAEKQEYYLTVKQSCPDTPEATSAEKQPYHLPLTVGLIVDKENIPVILGDDADDEELVVSTSRVLEVTQPEQVFTFTQVEQKPVVSLLRHFSAPVRLSVERTREDYVALMCYDEDAFSRWDATQQLAVSILNDLMQAYKQQKKIDIDPVLLEGLRAILGNGSLDKAMIALLLTLPTKAYLAEIAEEIDVDAIHYAHSTLESFLAEGLRDELFACYRSLNNKQAPYSATAEGIAERSLKNVALHYLLLVDSEEMTPQCYEQFSESNNMTDTMAAFKGLVHSVPKESGSVINLLAEYKRRALDEFYEQWKHENLVVNQWLNLQATIPQESTLEVVKELMHHESFSITNPNKVRALIAGFAQNLVAFHQASGEGYAFLAEQVIALNSVNPQIAARLITPFTRWRKFDKARKVLMKKYLQEIKETPNLSKDVYEVVSKSL